MLDFAVQHERYGALRGGRSESGDGRLDADAFRIVDSARRGDVFDRLVRSGLSDRVRIYATDINDAVIQRAKDGTFPLAKMREYTQNYIRAGGSTAFSDYYKVFGETARFDPTLVDNVVFAQHNLVSDAAFNEFHLIVCRNVMIYFDRSLQNKVHGLFLHSLSRFGVLALGHKESIRFTEHAAAYEELDGDEKIYRRVS